MPYLIDGDNLLGTWPDRSRSDADKRRLAGEVLRFARRAGRRAVVVFDGPEPPAQASLPDTVFSGSGRRADDVILERLRREADPRGWTVVTSDRSLADQCRWVGARVERCDRFRPRLREPTNGEKPGGRVDVDEWMDWFGVAEEGPDAGEP